MSSSEKRMVIVTAPSGAGKTSIVKALLNRNGSLAFSISATNRAKRHNEQHGIDYYFFSDAMFQAYRDSGNFIEWEEVYPNLYYGTLESELDRIWNQNKTVVFDIDVKGAKTIKQKFGARCCVIFIKTTSFEVLENRLRLRQTESESMLKKRLDKAQWELTMQDEFDHIVINDDLSEAIENCHRIIDRFANDYID